jgi:hypothetical protein
MRLAGSIGLWAIALILASPVLAGPAAELLPSLPAPLALENHVLDRSPVGGPPRVVFPAGATVDAAKELLTVTAPGSSRDLLAQRAVRDEVGEPKSVSEERAARRKSPGKALLLSAAVPGTGELYNGSNRGFIFLGVEALSWLAYFSFDASGDEKEVEFERFADTHWDIDRLKESLTDPNCPDPRPDSLDIVRIEDFRESNDQHYYEDVGKLDVYQCGWDAPQNRDSYRSIRRESNRLLTNARRAKTVAFINHIASAVDAFLLAKRYNKSLGQGIDMKLEMIADVQNPRGKVTFTRRFF